MNAKIKARLAKVLVALVILLLALATTGVALLIALFHRPGSYRPHQYTPDEMEQIEHAGMVKYNNLYNQVNLPDVFTVSYDQNFLNALLMHPGIKNYLDRAGGGQIRNPQLSFEPGRINLMAEVFYRKTTAVLRVGVRPSITPEGMLHLELEEPRAGLLPVPEDFYKPPLERVVKFLQQEEGKLARIPPKNGTPNVAEVHREIKAQFLPKLEELLTTRKVTLDAIFTPAPDRNARMVGLSLEAGRINLTLQPSER